MVRNPARTRRKQQHLRMVPTNSRPTVYPLTLSLRGGGPAPAPLPPPPPPPAPALVPPPPPAVLVPIPPPPYLTRLTIPAIAPHRTRTSTRHTLNLHMRSTIADLVALHRSLYFLQYMLRSLYRRVARTMATNQAAPNPARLARRTLSQRLTVESLCAHFSLHEARALVTLDFAEGALRAWGRIPGVVPAAAATAAGGGGGGGDAAQSGPTVFPRVFGRSERRMYVLVGRMLGEHAEMYARVGEMLRDFYAHLSPLYCGMQ